MNPTQIIAIVDVETTGLDPATAELIEIGAILVDRETGLSLGTLETKIAPTSIETAEPQALAVNGYNAAEWQNAPSLTDAMTKFAEFTRGATLMAYNVTFDYGFLREAFRKTGVQDTMRYQRLDLLTLAWSKLPPSASYSLKNVCIALGLEPEPAVHRGINGAMKAFEVYQALTATEPTVPAAPGVGPSVPVSEGTQATEVPASEPTEPTAPEGIAENTQAGEAVSVGVS